MTVVLDGVQSNSEWWWQGAVTEKAEKHHYTLLSLVRSGLLLASLAL